MSTSADSLLPDVPNRSEAEARNEKALRVARETIVHVDGDADVDYVAEHFHRRMREIVSILEAK